MGPQTRTWAEAKERPRPLMQQTCTVTERQKGEEGRRKEMNKQNQQERTNTRGSTAQESLRQNTNHQCRVWPLRAKRTSSRFLTACLPRRPSMESTCTRWPALQPSTNAECGGRRLPPGACVSKQPARSHDEVTKRCVGTSRD